MDFTDRLMAVDRAVSSYIRFAGDPSPPPSETVPELWADLLHWHERFVITDPPMSKREVRRFVNEAVKTFYEEREAIARGEQPLRRARREHPPEVLEARERMRAEEERLLAQLRAQPVRVQEGPWSSIRVDDRGCDHCGRAVELFHNESTGLSLCEECDYRANNAVEEAAPDDTYPADPAGDDITF